MATWGGGRRERQARVSLIAVGGLVSVGAVVWVAVQLGRGQEAGDAASLVGLVIAVVGLAVAVAGLRAAHAALGQPADAAGQARSAADTLARQIEKAEAEQWRALVGGDRRRINLRYTLHPQHNLGATAPGPRGLLFAEGAAASVPDIAAYYQATKPARLVVTGAPGAGKTVLALELLLALLEHRTDAEPVPVRVPLSGWNTSTPLDGFLIDHLVEAYDWPRARAAQLVEHDLVLPVLDGLDEMDPGLTDADGEPVLDAEGRQVPDPDAPQARAALGALNAYSRGRVAGPLVLTCRTAHYDALSDDDQLRDAARIRIDPVPAADAMAYLAARSGHATRWQPLLDHLQAEPSGMLARSLSTPWRLSLAATVYRRTGNPAELLTHPTPQALDEHLLARLIPATHVLHPPPGRYTPDQVRTWLAVLAHHLQPPGTEAPTAASSAPRTDIHLHQLWPIPGASRVKRWDVVLSGLTALTPLPLAWTVSAPETLVIAGGVLAFACLTAVRGHQTMRPSRIVWQTLTTPTGRHQLTFDLGKGLVRGVGYAIMLGLATGLAIGLSNVLTNDVGLARALGAGVNHVFTDDIELARALTAGLTLSVTYALLMGVEGSPDSVSRPGDVVRADILYGLTAGVTFGLAVAFVFRPMYGSSGGYTLGLAAGFALGLTWGAPASRRYLAFLLCARHRRLLPFRLNTFLTWAYDAHLLRLSGNAYQFRHRELQLWLATRPQPGP